MHSSSNHPVFNSMIFLMTDKKLPIAPVTSGRSTNSKMTKSVLISDSDGSDLFSCDFLMSKQSLRSQTLLIFLHLPPTSKDMDFRLFKSNKVQALAVIIDFYDGILTI